MSVGLPFWKVWGGVCRSLPWAPRSLSLQASSLSRGALAFVARSLPASSVPTPPPAYKAFLSPSFLSLQPLRNIPWGDLIVYQGRGPHCLSPFTPPLPCEALPSIYVSRQTELLVWSFSPPLRQVVEPISQPGKQRLGKAQASRQEGLDPGV